MSAIELLRRFNRPSSTTSSHDVSRMAKVAEVGKRFLRIAVESFIGRRRHQPIMIWYASDSTPLSTREMHRRSWECYRVRRSGRRSNDLLLQRLFVQDCAGDAAILFTEPLALEDKSTWSHYEAFRRLLPTGRELGHEALLVSFHCFDRALESSMDRRIRQLRERACGNGTSRRDPRARPTCATCCRGTCVSGASCTTHTTAFAGASSTTQATRIACEPSSLLWSLCETRTIF